MPSAAPPSIGTKLRSARLRRALSIEETAWRTRIRPDLLRALEGEDFESIGHQAFVRRHLHSYARFLGMDAEQVMEEFVSQSDDIPSAIGELDRQERVAKKPPRAKWLIAATLSGVVLIAGAAVGLLGGQAERPSGDSVSLGQVTPRRTASTASRSRSVPAAEARVRLVVTGLADTAVSIRVDGLQVLDGKIRAGATKTFLARDVIEILAANGGTIRVTLNGTSVATGAPGAVYRARFGPHGPLRD